MRLFNLFFVICLLPNPTKAIVLGQVDAFDSASSWSGITASVEVMPGGGPAGEFDPYLRATSSVGTQLGINTKMRWDGDYLAAGVTAISADLQNLGAAMLHIRILIFNSTYGDFTSTEPVLLPADGQWHRVVFGVTPDHLTWVGPGAGNVVATLTDVGGLMIRHQLGDPLPRTATTPIASTLGIDNITALPEPSCLVGIICIAGSFRPRRRRKTKQSTM